MPGKQGGLTELGRADVRGQQCLVDPTTEGQCSMGEDSSLPVHETRNGHTGSAIPGMRVDVVDLHESSRPLSHLTQGEPPSHRSKVSCPRPPSSLGAEQQLESNFPDLQVHELCVGAGQRIVDRAGV